MRGAILIVDDNPDNLSVLEAMLLADGHEVRSARNGEIALRAVSSLQPELILLDIMMPGMDGLEVCRRLKETPATASIPIIFISALNAMNDKIMAFQAGGVDYITKPFAEGEILARVQTHLKLARAQEQLLRTNRELSAEIQARQAAEGEAIRSASLLKATLDSTADGILVVDGKGKILDYNRRFLELWRIPREIICTNDDERLLELVRNQLDDPVEFMKEVRRLYAHPEEENFDTISFRDGRIFERYSRPLRAVGVVRGRVWSFRDITERVRAVEKLRASEELYATIFNHISIGMALINPKMEIVFMNPVMKALNPHIDPDQRPLCYESFNIPSRSEICPYCPTVRTLRDGQVHSAVTDTPTERGMLHLRITAAPVRESDGSISAVIEVVEDITDRIRAENALRESRELLNAIVEGTTDSVYAKDRDGRLLLFNSAASRNTGKRAEDVLGKDASAVFSREEARAITEKDRALMADGGTITFEEEFVIGDSRKVFLTTKGPLTGEDGTVAGIFGISRDITELKRSEAERLEMERRLLHSQKMESLGVLAGGMAHDFNNLLSVILGNLDLVRLKLQPGAPPQSNIEAALDACQRAMKLIGRMLDYAGKNQMLLGANDLKRVVEENAPLVRASVPGNIRLVISTPADLPAVKADRNQLRQVFMDLITNATEAIGGEPGAITVTTGVMECDDTYLGRSRIAEKPSAGRFVYLEVEDSGCGMDESTQARLFDPFYTTKFMGRGLGMSAVMGIVRAHGGAILLESGVGKGTSFRILFPALEAAPLPAGDGAQADKTVPPEEKHGAILVVDDEESVRTLCMTIVEMLGFRAMGAADGREALEIFERQAGDIALVILDMTMPTFDGVATFHELRRRRPDVRVIVSSGYGEEEMTARFSGDSPAGFIQKPFKVEELRGTIHRAIGR